MSEPRIRPAVPADAAILAELGARTFRETFAADNRPEDLEAYLRESFGEAIQRAELGDAALSTWLVVSGEQPVAYAQLRLAPPPSPVDAPGAIELRRLYVDRRWHGQGLAQRLMSAVEGAASARAATGLWLGVWERNPRAIAFYRKSGFLDVGSQTFVVGSDPQTDRVMLRPLPTSAGPARAPERLFTPRLVIERPRMADAPEIFERYASDPEVTTYVAFPRHRSVADAEWFIGFSDHEWARWPAGPYLVRDRQSRTLLGSSGLAYETPFRVSTGYVLARDAWGRGYATEALAAMVDVARALGVRRLHALLHVDHDRSARVLEKCGFMDEGVRRRYDVFPNLAPDEPSDVRCYARVW